MWLIFVSEVFDQIERDHGGVDIVCNNAGIVSYDDSVEDSQRGFRVNMVNKRTCSANCA